MTAHHGYLLHEKTGRKLKQNVRMPFETFDWSMSKAKIRSSDGTMLNPHKTSERDLDYEICELTEQTWARVGVYTRVTG